MLSVRILNKPLTITIKPDINKGVQDDLIKMISIKLYKKLI